MFQVHDTYSHVKKLITACMCKITHMLELCRQKLEYFYHSYVCFRDRHKQCFMSNYQESFKWQRKNVHTYTQNEGHKLLRSQDLLCMWAFTINTECTRLRYVSCIFSNKKKILCDHVQILSFLLITYANSSSKYMKEHSMHLKKQKGKWCLYL